MACILLFIFGVFSLAWHAQCQKVVSDECGKSLACLKSPASCSNNRNCNILVSYKYIEDSDQVEFVISGNMTWMAIAQVETLKEAKMTGLKGQACIKSGLTPKLVSISSIGNTRPGEVDAVSSITNISLSMDEGLMVCKFRRPVSVNSDGAYMYDFSKPLYQLYAAGSSSSGNLSYHREGIRSYTAVAEDLRFKGSAVSTSSAPPATLVSSTAMSLLTSDCGQTLGCLVSPRACQSFADCDVVVKYQFDPSTQEVFLSMHTKWKWVGFGLVPASAPRRMTGLKGHYCVSSASIVFGSFHASSEKTPDAFQPMVNGVKFTSGEVSNGWVSCRFSRPLSVPAGSDDFLYNLNATGYLSVIAYGGRIGSDRPAYHGVNNYLSYENVDFTKSVSAKVSASSPSRSVIAHGVLMALAWMLCSTCGIFVARYMKPGWSDRKIFNLAVWFQVHRGIMIICWILFVTAFSIILAELKGWSAAPRAHHWVGLTTLILGFCQPIVALLRCNPDHEKRFIFNWIHRSIGFSAWVLGAVAIILGLQLRGMPYTHCIAYVVVVPVAFVLVDLSLLIQARGGRHASVEFSAVDGDHSAQIKSLESQSLALRTFGFVAVFIIALFFCLWTIILIVKESP